MSDILRQYGMVDRLKKLIDIIENTIDRPMTKEEYKAIKEFPLFDDVKQFWVNHLTSAGYDEYRKSDSQGRYGKWNIYQDIYKRYNTSLYKAMK